MTKKIILWMVIFLAFGTATMATAGQGRLDFVETEVILFSDGKASIEYVVRWIVTAGEFHGFYFSGFDRLTPRFDYQNAAGTISDTLTFMYDMNDIRDFRGRLILHLCWSEHSFLMAQKT